MSRRAVAFAGICSLIATLMAVAPVIAEGEVCPAPSEPMQFESDYIDTTRAGGEPIVQTHPEGHLMWGSHAGTTHFYTPAAADADTAAFLQNYEGQTYQYVSEDGGENWKFVPRTPISSTDPESGLPNSGFSDPEFAIDLAGNVYISEINLANIAVSKSTDGGRSYKLQSLAEVTMTDRQWMEADEEDVLWFVGNTFGGGTVSSGDVVTKNPLHATHHRLYKSTDGGKTFSVGQSLGGQQSSDITIDRTDGSLYELHSTSRDGEGVLELWIARDARNQTPPNVTFENVGGEPTTTPTSAPIIADRYDRKSSIGPTLDIDPNGNLYVVWDDDGGEGREPGIYFTYSTDRGMTWAEAVRLDDGTGTAFWPWVAAGSHGATVAWLQNEENVTNNDPQRATEGWHVMAAQIQACDSDGDGGLDSVSNPVAVQATTEPVHEGTICTGGTFCQAQLIDRRLGDYFANEIDRDGNTYISVSDTMQGGSVALPRIIRQVGGPGVGDPYDNPALWPHYVRDGGGDPDPEPPADCPGNSGGDGKGNGKGATNGNGKGNGPKC